MGIDLFMDGYEWGFMYGPIQAIHILDEFQSPHSRHFTGIELFQNYGGVSRIESSPSVLAT